MNFERVEQAYHLLLENVQTLENELQTHAYDALIEQNAHYLGTPSSYDLIASNNEILRGLELSQEEWRRAFQFLLMKLNHMQPLQANHQLTPDSIGFIVLFMIETLYQKDKVIDVLEIGSGTGNLAHTLLANASKPMSYMGLEVDDLLIDLSASISDILESDAAFVQEDAVRPQILKESDVVIGDLPVGYYPNDTIAKRYQVFSDTEHTYAHHLLMEQALKYLKSDGFAIFLAPIDLLTSSQSHLFKQWLTDQAQLMGVITLPDRLFGQINNAKSIYLFRKKENAPVDPFVYPLTDLQDAAIIRQFTEAFKKWSLAVSFS